MVVLARDKQTGELFALKFIERGPQVGVQPRIAPERRACMYRFMICLEITAHPSHPSEIFPLIAENQSVCAQRGRQKTRTFCVISFISSPARTLASDGPLLSSPSSF